MAKLHYGLSLSCLLLAGGDGVRFLIEILEDEPLSFDHPQSLLPVGSN